MVTIELDKYEAMELYRFVKTAYDECENIIMSVEKLLEQLQEKRAV